MVAGRERKPANPRCYPTTALGIRSLCPERCLFQGAKAKQQPNPTRASYSRRNPILPKIPAQQCAFAHCSASGDLVMHLASRFLSLCPASSRSSNNGVPGRQSHTPTKIIFQYRPQSHATDTNTHTRDDGCRLRVRWCSTVLPLRDHTGYKYRLR